jgi:cell division protein FtsQ
VAAASTDERAGAALPAGRPGAPAAQRRRRRVLVLLIVFTVVVGGGTWLVYGSPMLTLRSVDVRGTRVLTPERVRAAAGVHPGGSLADVDTSAVERRLRRALPRIARVRAERSWPHTLRLSVTERTTVAVTPRGPAPGAGFTEVDQEGVRFAHVRGKPAGVPLVRVVRTPLKGQTGAMFDTRRLLRAAVEAARELPPEVRARTDSIEVHSYDDIRLELSGGRTAEWGSAELGARKGQVLVALLKAVPHADRYDVSAPSAPATG